MYITPDFLFGYMGLDERKPDFVANNKDLDQPAHLCSLISAFVICFLLNITCYTQNLDILGSLLVNDVGFGVSSVYYLDLVSVAEQA